MNTMTLLGTEDISRSASRMRDAAETMANVSGNLQAVLEVNQRFMDDWLLRFERVLEEHATKLIGSQEQPK